MYTKDTSSTLATLTGSCLLAALLSVPAGAAPIDGFGIGDGALLDADALLVAYDNDSDSLFVTGLGNSTATLTDEEGTPLSIDGTGLFVVLSIDGTGILSGGSLQVSGSVDELGFESGVLLTGEATDFGFFEAGETRGGEDTDELQLVFTITGGDAAGLWDGQIAVRFTNTGFLGSFANDWVNDGDGITLVGQAIPVPGAVWLMLSGLAVAGWRGRRR
ncbi:MAG: hypothetical protein AAGA68_17545 [Pseudomonadota bacterium]